MTVRMDFNQVRTEMKDYEVKLEEQRDPEWVRTASKVMTFALFTLGMIAFLSSSVVGLPAWLVVATLVGWAASVILSTIWMKSLSSKEAELKENINMCKIINSDSHPDHALFVDRFNLLNCRVSSEDIKNKILTYCRGLIYEKNTVIEHKNELKDISDKLKDVFNP